MKKIIQSIIAATFILSPITFAEMINLNTADATIIQENLKGVGEKKAQAIVAYRDKQGTFQSIEEIMEVKGIGKGIFKKIKADLSLTEGLGVNKITTTTANLDENSANKADKNTRITTSNNTTTDEIVSNDHVIAPPL